MEVKKHFCSLSEAIRAGATCRPQEFGDYTRGVFKTSCALAAAVEAVTGDIKEVYRGDEDSLDFLGRTFPYVLRPVTCPKCGEGTGDILSVVGHLNDEHRWAREKIADWLESEEEKLGYVTVSDEGFGSTQREGGFPAQYVERLDVVCRN